MRRVVCIADQLGCKTVNALEEVDNFADSFIGKVQTGRRGWIAIREGVGPTTFCP